ncbi:MAG TPA: DinB family protein [Candidatus Hydrogenedentes bacterium]|nr:DinB family protein [Candidatus Hydrogenedentota bacterium]HQE82731.1 DinB family protein [Candidatus Hydrogenedentota bacterium]HQH51702.1 DinB family protein [Candidatus Hydrogenedentota bacterium]HQM47203.1 DinB family protein [Candidatus Hydrogenedentota bacterium]
MRIAEAMAQEMAQEAKGTRRLLERLPADLFGWKPHEKSMPLGHLASHLADCLGYAPPIITMDELQFNPEEYKPVIAESAAGLLQMFDKHLEEALGALDGVSDQHMMKNWKMVMGGKPIIDLPRYAVLRSMVLNHHYHHRGQLAVYARMNNVPLPAIYGPSADERG